jgi:hypothetical protein
MAKLDKLPEGTSYENLFAHNWSGKLVIDENGTEYTWSFYKQGGIFRMKREWCNKKDHWRNDPFSFNNQKEINTWFQSTNKPRKLLSVKDDENPIDITTFEVWSGITEIVWSQNTGKEEIGEIETISFTDSKWVISTSERKTNRLSSSEFTQILFEKEDENTRHDFISLRERVKVGDYLRYYSTYKVGMVVVVDENSITILITKSSRSWTNIYYQGDTIEWSTVILDKKSKGTLVWPVAIERPHTINILDLSKKDELHDKKYWFYSQLSPMKVTRVSKDKYEIRWSSTNLSLSKDELIAFLVFYQAASFQSKEEVEKERGYF